MGRYSQGHGRGGVFGLSMLKSGRLKKNKGRAPALLLFMAAGAAVVSAAPLAYIVVYALGSNPDIWLRLINTRIPLLIWNTGILALLVSFMAAVLGTSLAFLLWRSDLPGRRFLRRLLIMPLAFPPYVGALSFIIIFGPRGVMRELTGSFLPVYGSLLSTAAVLTLFCYPYVYLIVMSSLSRMKGSYEEAGLSCGLSYRRVFVKVVLPMLRPAIGAGTLLVALYVISDFGAVAMLRYDTFVRAIYYQIEGRFDFSGAAILSVFLIIATLVLMRVEMAGRKGRSYSSSSDEKGKEKIMLLKKWKIPALLFVCGVFTMSVLLPLSVLFYWSYRGIASGAVSDAFWSYAVNSFTLAALVSVLCMVFSMPVVYIKSRFPSFLSRAFYNVSYCGYALPGVVTALGIIFFFHRFMPWFYPTLIMAAAALFIRFFPQALGTSEASLESVPPALDEAARSLGTGSLQVIRRVVSPLMMPGILSGGALVFVSSLKELPATLLLRPPGFDTLSVRVWMDASEGFYETAAPAALVIVAVAAFSVKIIMKKFEEVK